jgi:hypothetical protein
MKTETYKNRYGETFTFTPTANGNVIWEGKFEYYRVGFPNDYTDAYRAYTTNGGLMGLEEFKQEVHHSIYDENDRYVGPSDIMRVYGPLVETRKDIINMVDPSGGPYLSEGMSSTTAHSEIEGKKISHFIPLQSGGYEIVLKD